LKRLDQLLQRDRSTERQGDGDGQGQGDSQCDQQTARWTFGEP
jgi:hypothetical protein